MLGQGIALAGTFAAGSLARRALAAGTSPLVVAALLVAGADAVATLLVLFGVI